MIAFLSSSRVLIRLRISISDYLFLNPTPEFRNPKFLASIFAAGEPTVRFTRLIASHPLKRRSRRRPDYRQALSASGPTDSIAEFRFGLLILSSRNPNS
jgi:hypothetical protein